MRDASNDLVISSAVGTQTSILQTTSTGTAVYVETHTPTTNANGLISLQIGVGTVVSGTFASIDWRNGPYFIKTETDPTGGTAYTITGTSQLLIVPYALYAETSGAGSRLWTQSGTDVEYTAGDALIDGLSVGRGGNISFNTANGNNALTGNTTGSNNTAIGYIAQVPNGTLSNQVCIGNSSVTYAGVQVAWAYTSDKRWKSDIQSSELGLNFISKLSLVKYYRNNDEGKKTEYGFIAQELEEVLNNSGATNNGIISKDDAGMYVCMYVWCALQRPYSTNSKGHARATGRNYGFKKPAE